MLRAVATFTWPAPAELEEFLRRRGIQNIEEFRGIEAGSVNSNFSLVAGGERYFLRLYEEQDLDGACSDAALTEELGRRGVPTPATVAPLGGAGSVEMLASRPAVLLEWAAGAPSCQRAVTPSRARAVGEALARVHRASAGLTASPGRFGPDALRRRLDTIESSRLGAEAAPLRAALDRVVAERTATPVGLIHGDLFRDNVLWEGERLVALLDFESASIGSYAFDLAVTVLAWCFGDDFEAPLMSAMVEGYESVRPLEQAERAALWNEARAVAVRFAITRITDYALRTEGTGVLKDYRRFLARLEALEVMGAEAFQGSMGL
jgi:homoserine kinase type II